MKTRFLKNLSFNVIAQFSYLVLQFIILMIVPKVVTVEEYGLFQTFMFYLSYVVILQLGWSEGMYVNGGGLRFRELDRDTYIGQIKAFFWLELIISTCFFFLGVLMTSGNMRFIFLMLAISIFIKNFNGLGSVILTMTNRVAAFAFVIMIQSIFNAVILIILILLHQLTFKTLILTTMTSMLLSGVVNFLKIRPLTNVHHHVPIPWSEIKKNVSLGMPLLFANLASLLVIGTIRFFIQQRWDLETFAKISLPLSLSNIVMVFVTAISVTIFPVLKRLTKKNIIQKYSDLRAGVTCLFLIILLTYFPLKMIILLWIPKYSDSLWYMGILFPVVFYQANFEIFIATFMRVFLMGKTLFWINLISVGLGAILGFISAYVFHNIAFAVFSIIIVMAAKKMIGDLFMRPVVKVAVLRPIMIELSMILIFIFSALSANIWIGLGSYFITLIIYMMFEQKQIKAAFKAIREI
ncbi:MAG: hypothetical protein LBS41_05995 [Streptococcaceae bacterium]|jgi:O-antigen/teichoic acid export membrane protein|nr:hypothetical protein [Streptococcaceae bacterium]